MSETNPLHILYAEDDRSLREDVTEWLERRQNCRVTEACDGQEALERATANGSSFDALLTDNRMPKMTGLALIQEVKRVRPNMFCILFSGDVSRTDFMNKMAQAEFQPNAAIKKGVDALNALEQVLDKLREVDRER